FAVQYWNGSYYLIIGAGFFFDTYTALAYAPINLEIGADYRLEGRFVGPDLSMKVWRLDKPEPAQPQLHGTTPQWGDPYLKYSAIGVELDSFWSTGAHRVEVDDITFCSAHVDDPPTIDPQSIPVSGVPVPRLAILDDLTRNYMAITRTKSIV